MYDLSLSPEDVKLGKRVSQHAACCGSLLRALFLSAQETKGADGKAEIKKNPNSIFGVTLDAIMKLQSVSAQASANSAYFAGLLLGDDRRRRRRL
jgi:hypothetical protein